MGLELVYVVNLRTLRKLKMSSTYTEELKDILAKYDDKVMFSGGASCRAWKNKRFNEVNTFIQQKVTEAQDKFERIAIDSDNGHGYIRTEFLLSQLNHNKKGDSDVKRTI